LSVQSTGNNSRNVSLSLIIKLSNGVVKGSYSIANVSPDRTLK